MSRNQKATKTPKKIKTVWSTRELVSKEELQWAMVTWSRIEMEPSRNVFEDLRLLRRVTDVMYRRIHADTAWNQDLLAALRSYEQGVEFFNSNKPWDEREDIVLIQGRAEGEDILQLARSLGRTPAAIATRISQLVGVPREFTNIDGKRIEGELEGDAIDGKFTGKVHRLS